jgi:hypothetical protein
MCCDLPAFIAGHVEKNMDVYIWKFRAKGQRIRKWIQVEGRHSIKCAFASQFSTGCVFGNWTRQASTFFFLKTTQILTAICPLKQRPALLSHLTGSHCSFSCNAFPLTFNKLYYHLHIIFLCCLNSLSSPKCLRVFWPESSETTHLVYKSKLWGLGVIYNHNRD